MKARADYRMCQTPSEKDYFKIRFWVCPRDDNHLEKCLKRFKRISFESHTEHRNSHLRHRRTGMRCILLFLHCFGLMFTVIRLVASALGWTQNGKNGISMSNSDQDGPSVLEWDPTLKSLPRNNKMRNSFKGLLWGIQTNQPIQRKSDGKVFVV